MLKSRSWQWVLWALWFLSAALFLYISIGFYSNTEVRTLIYIAIGFSVVELALLHLISRHPAVVLVLFILVLPIFVYISLGVDHHHHARRGLQTEAKFNLDQIYESAALLLSQRKTFVITEASQLGFTYHQPAARYTVWYAVNGVPTRLNVVSPERAAGCDDPPAIAKVAASSTGFTAAARGNIDDGATCDEWSINDAKVLTNTLNDLNH